MNRHILTISLFLLLLGGSLYMHLRAEGESSPCEQVRAYQTKIAEIQSRYPALGEKVTEENRTSLLYALNSEISAFSHLSPPSLAHTQYRLALDTLRDFQDIVRGGSGDDFNADFAGDQRAQEVLSSSCP